MNFHLTRSFRLAATFLFGVVVLAGCHRAPPVTGDFSGIALPQHSLAIAHVDVYLHFTTAASQAWFAQQHELASRFGPRLVITPHFALAAGESDAPMRLYLLAKDHGKDGEVASALMGAGLPADDPDKTLVLSAFLASRFGLRSAFDDSTNDAAMHTRLASVIQQTQQQLQYEPTLILNHQMMLGGDMQNAQAIISAVLKPAG